jgi:peptide/nickel transport system permease protein
MGGLTKQYLITRAFMWLLTIWLGTSAVFFIPRLAPGDPVTAQVTRMMQVQGRIENAQEIIESWKNRFGLNDPLYVQYFRYMGNLVRFDFGYSLSNFPSDRLGNRQARHTMVCASAGGSPCFSFSIGITIGALMGWRKTPRWLQNILPLQPDLYVHPLLYVWDSAPLFRCVSASLAAGDRRLQPVDVTRVGTGPTSRAS